MGERPPAPSAPKGLRREHLQRPQAGVARVVEQHRDVGVVLGCEVEAERDMRPRVVVGELDPWNAADDVGAERQRLFHQAVGAQLLDDSVLRESDHLNVDDSAKFLAHGDQRLDAFESGLAVDVGERADVENAVQRRQRRGAAGVRRDPGGVVFRLDRARQIDGAERLAHVRAMVGGERGLVHHRQRPHLAEMQVGIDERFGDQTALGVDRVSRRRADAFADGDDPAACDGDVDELRRRRAASARCR